MTPEQIAQLAGTTGLILAGAYTIRELWNEHKRHDADVVAEKAEALAGWKAQTAATDRLNDSVDKLIDRLDEDSPRRR